MTGNAKSGRPPRDTTARTTACRFAAATSAAACSRARAEVADRQLGRDGLRRQPVSGGDQTLGEKWDVEAKVRGRVVGGRFVGGEEIE
jgi:hypothetical protein